MGLVMEIVSVKSQQSLRAGDLLPGLYPEHTGYSALKLSCEKVWFVLGVPFCCFCIISCGVDLTELHKDILSVDLFFAQGLKAQWPIWAVSLKGQELREVKVT